MIVFMFTRLCVSYNTSYVRVRVCVCVCVCVYVP